MAQGEPRSGQLLRPETERMGLPPSLSCTPRVKPPRPWAVSHWEPWQHGTRARSRRDHITLPKKHTVPGTPHVEPKEEAEERCWMLGGRGRGACNAKDTQSQETSVLVSVLTPAA